MTLDTWLESNSNNTYAKDAVAALYPIAHGAMGGMRPSMVSVLHVARQLKAAPQVEAPETWLFWGAAGQFPEHLAKDIAEQGGKAIINAPCTKLVHGDEGVSVITPRGTWNASYVVMAMPPHLTGRIDYEPELPVKRSQLMDRAPMGTTIKVCCGGQQCKGAAPDAAALCSATLAGADHGLISATAHRLPFLSCLLPAQVLAFYETPVWRKGAEAPDFLSFALQPEVC